MIYAIGALVAANCALLGSFLVLRRLSMLGDAISHAVLPGIALAFMITHSLGSLPNLVGAGLFGLATVLLVELLNRTRRLYSDTSIGVVFPAFFSLGVILITRYVSDAHLDTNCVLFGDILWTPFDRVVVPGIRLPMAILGEGPVLLPKALLGQGLVLLMNAGIVALLYKELKLATFDPGLAETLGFKPGRLHYLLMAAVSITVVASFEAVGAILVVALLVVPASTAFLLTHRFGWMLGLSVGLGIASTWIGFRSAVALDISPAGAMAVTAGLLFTSAMLFAPRHGFLARRVTRRRMTDRLEGNILLLHLKDRAEVLPEEEVRDRFGWSDRRLHRLLRSLGGAGLVDIAGGGLRLTPAGARRIDEAGAGPLADPR